MNAIKRQGVDAIDGRTATGRKAKAWRAYALQKKGGEQCPIDTREKIEAGTFSLWRALFLQSYIVADAEKPRHSHQQAAREATSDPRAIRHRNESVAADKRLA